MRDYSYTTRDTSYCIRYSDPTSGWGYYPGPGAEHCYTGQFLTGAKGRADLIRGDKISSYPYSAFRVRAKAHFYDQTRIMGGIHAGQLSYNETVVGTPHCTAPNELTPYMIKGTSVSGHTYWAIGLHAETVSRARNNLLAKLAEATPFQLGQTLGEIKQTALTIDNRMQQLIGVLKAIRQKNFGLALHRLGLKNYKLRAKTIAGVYLELKFGWLQLMKDIYYGYQNVQEILNRESGVIVHCAVRTTSYISASYLLPVSVIQMKREGTIRYGVKTGVTYRVDGATLHALNSLGVANPIALAWELLPLSFVADWVVSVGSYLTGLSATWGLSFVSGYETSSVESRITFYDYGQLQAYFPEVPTVFDCNSNAMSRAVLTTFPRPAMRMTLGMDFSKAVTLAALFAQRKG